MRAAVSAGAVVAALLVVNGCSAAKIEPSDTADRNGSRPTSAPSSASAGRSSCSAQQRPLPAWAAEYASFAGAKVVSDRDRVIGVLFTPPLRSPKSEESTNKILWVVDSPRGNNSLQITGRQVGGSKSFRVTQAPDAETGNVYPTVVDAPSAGCWRFTLTWGASTDTVELAYVR